MSAKHRKTVSATVMGQHLGLSRTFIDKLAAEGVLSRQPDGRFDPDATRLAYLRHVRQARRASPATEARARLDAAKARQVEVMNGVRERKLIDFAEHIGTIDEICGVLRTALGSLPARATRDLILRRQIEVAVTQTLQEIANIAGRRARASEKPEGHNPTKGRA